MDGGSGLLRFSCSHAGNGQHRAFGLLLGNFVGWDGVGLDCWINTPVDIACELRIYGGGVDMRYMTSECAYGS